MSGVTTTPRVFGPPIRSSWSPRRDENGRIYKLAEAPSFGGRPDDSLEGVILVIGGKHDGALYFPAGDAPPETQFVELRYPTGDTRRVVDLSK